MYEFCRHNVWYQVARATLDLVCEAGCGKLRLNFINAVPSVMPSKRAMTVLPVDDSSAPHAHLKLLAASIYP